MTQYTDAELTINITGVDLTQSENVHVTIRQGTAEVDLYGDAITILGAHDITCIVPQAETAKLRSDAPAQIQINLITGGIRKASNIWTAPVFENLLGRVI